MHSAALLLLPLLPLTAAQSVIVTISEGVTTTFTLPAWLYPPSGTASSTVTVTPTATLVVVPITTVYTGLTTTTVYVGSSTITMSPSPITTTTTFNSAVSSYLSSVMSVETAGSTNATSTSTATVSSTSTSTSTATATTTVIAGMPPSCHPFF